MKRTKMATILIVVGLLWVACSTTPPTSTITFSPEKPTATSTVKVTFTAGKNSPLLKAESVLMQAQLYSSNPSDLPVLEEIPMTKSGKKWTASLALEGKNVGAILFQFASGDGVDSNDKQGWDLMVYDESGNPVKGAYAALARTYTMAIYMERNGDREKALELLQKELELYPDNLKAKVEAFNLKYRLNRRNEEKLAELKSEMDKLLEENPENMDVLEAAYSFYSGIRDTEKSQRILDSIKKLEPGHRILFSMEYSKLRQERNPQKQIQQARALLSQLKDDNMRETVENFLVTRLMDSKDWRGLLSFLQKLEKPSPRILNSAAWKMVEENRMLTQAADLARKAVETYRSQSESEKPSYMPKRLWERSQKRSLGMALDTYGFALFKLGKLDESEKALREAYEVTNGEEAEITQRFLGVLRDNGKTDELLEIAQKAIESNNSNEKINELFRTAYTEKYGDSAKADSLLGAAKEKAKENRMEEIAKHFIQDAKPAPTFTLKNLNGESVSLESLRGKTVIVDFWATWCGPCKASFPYLQKFWEQHQNDPDVMVLAVNCWEQKKGKERIDHVARFLKDNGYTFPVLIDEKDEVVSAYKVEGIPTKFFVGPDGKIYFKDVGYSGPQMLDDMNIELGMIRNKVKSTD